MNFLRTSRVQMWGSRSDGTGQGSRGSIKLSRAFSFAVRLIALAILAVIGRADAAPGSLVRLDPAAAIAARQASFKRIGTALKSVTDQLKMDTPNKSVMVNSAQTISTSARELTRLFPVGSQSVAGLSTKALPEIWTQRAQFDARMSRLVAEAGRLASAANGGNANETRAQARTLGAVCSDCHRRFRSHD